MLAHGDAGYGSNSESRGEGGAGGYLASQSQRFTSFLDCYGEQWGEGSRIFRNRLQQTASTETTVLMTPPGHSTLPTGIYCVSSIVLRAVDL